MKLIFTSLLLFIATYTTCLAQQARKTDDALLLEYYQNNRFAEAFNYLKTVYTEPVTNAKELSRLAYTASMGNKLAEAEGFYQRMYDRDTTDKVSLQNMANINLRRGNVFKAEGFLKKYILIDSTNFEVYKDLANFKRLDPVSQLKYLQKANKLDSVEFDVASDLSDLYVKLQQFAQAEKVLSVAIAADPENIILLESLLRLASAQKKWPLAVKTGEQLIKAGDESAFVTTKLGVAYYHTKNYRCGIETLVAMPEISQTEVTAYFTAACYKQLKDQKNAISFFEKAIKLSISPSTNTYYSEMADSYETTKQLSKALASYQKALLYDEKALTFYFLANLYDVKLNDQKSALKYFKKYLAAKPDEKEEKEYIAYTKSRLEQLTIKTK
nr:tetratricopeptide repeat protein [uncultured Mucilaginibacter sp.]